MPDLFDNLVKVVGQDRKSRLERNTTSKYGYYVNTNDHVQMGIGGYKTPKLLNTIRENQFSFIAAIGTDYVVSCAVVNLKWLSHAFLSVYIPNKNINLYVSSLAGIVRFPRTPDSGNIKYIHPCLSINIKSFGSDKRKEISFKTRKCKGNIIINEDYDPIVATSRDDKSSFVFTQKLVGSRCVADLEINSQRYNFSDASAVVDWSSGVYPKLMAWRWAACTWQDNGKTIGFNLSDNDNKTNYLWCEHGIINLPIVNFEYDCRNLIMPWLIKSADGSVDLVFTPEIKHCNNQDYKLISSDFNQCIGRFEGTLKLIDNNGVGRLLKINHRLGFCETNSSKLSLK